MKKTTPDQLLSDAFGPVIDYCRAHRGSIARIQRRAQKLSGLSWSRQSFEQYLNSNPRRQVEPRLGMGLLILRAAADVIRENGDAK